MTRPPCQVSERWLRHADEASGSREPFRSITLFPGEMSRRPWKSSTSFMRRPGVMVLYFLHQVVSRSFDPFAPVWLFLVGYLQVYVFQAISFHDWAVDVRGRELVAAANFRSFWALAWFLLVYQLGPARMAARILPRPPRNWSPLLAAVVSPPLIVWGLFCANMFVSGDAPTLETFYQRRSALPLIPVRDAGCGRDARDHRPDGGRPCVRCFLRPGS